LAQPNAAQNRASSKDLSVLRALVPFLRPYRARICLAFVFLIVAAAATLVTPLILRQVVDQGFIPAVKTGNVDLLTNNLLWLALAGTVMALAAGARFMIVSWLGERVVNDVRRQIYSRLLNQSPAYFETVSTGEVLSRLTADTTLIQTLIGSSLSMGLRNFILLVGSIVMLFVTNVKVTAIVLSMISVVMIIILLFTRRLRRLSRASQDRVADVSSLAGEVLNAMTTVQSNTQENFERTRFNDRAEQAFATGMRRTKIRALAMVFIMLAFLLALLYGTYLGGTYVVAGKVSIGELSQFAVYALMVGSAAGVMAEVWGDLQRAAGASERLVELLNAEPTVKQASKPTPVPTAQGGLQVRFDHVSFKYPSRPDRAVLADINLVAQPGQRLALVGTSGAGKSTLFALLQRQFEPQTGSISLSAPGSNPVQIQNISLHDLRHQMSVVSQEPVIFSANALENIRYGKPEASVEQVHEAARAAQIHDFLISLPQGYETFLGERGVRLSGGQKQRLAIARAILRDSPILLLDEATSALDAENESLVQQALETAMSGRTCLIIAHRLSTIRYCDVIHVLEQGHIIESGTHDELIERNGIYSRLVSLQSLS
jgi:ATP-binding cassette, subfamily B, bacterial